MNERMPTDPVASAPATVAVAPRSSLTLAECRALAKGHPRGAQIIAQLLASRVIRIGSWGPAKGGKTTTLIAAMKYFPGECWVWSIDHDVSPWDRVMPTLLPLPTCKEELPLLRTALLLATAEAKTALINGQVSMVLLDTITTMRRRLKWMDDYSQQDFGINATQQSNMQKGAARNSMCVGLGEQLFSLSEAARLSPLDSPIVLALTQHARGVTVSQVKGDPADKANLHNFDIRFHHWEPKITADTGMELYGMMDMQMGVSLNTDHQTLVAGGGLKGPDFSCTITGGHCGNRLTETEVGIFNKVMATRDRDRLGRALSAIWGLRKLTWARAYKLL